MIKIKKIALALAVGALPLTLGACATEETPVEEVKEESTEVEKEVAKVKEMQGEELQAIQNDNEKKNDYLLIDVRSEEEYLAGHIKHAINISSDEIESKLAELEEYKEKPVILYCNSGAKSSEAAEVLVKNGFTDVTNAQGVKDYEYDKLYTYTNVTYKGLEAAVGDDTFTIVDVRPVEDYEAGHIEGAVNVPFDKVEENLDKIPKDSKVITYCFTGNKSSEVAEMLVSVDSGYENVYNTLDGTKEHEYKLVK